MESGQILLAFSRGALEFRSSSKLVTAGASNSSGPCHLALDKPSLCPPEVLACRTSCDHTTNTATKAAPDLDQDQDPDPDQDPDGDGGGAKGALRHRRTRTHLLVETEACVTSHVP